MNRNITNKINYILDNWVPPRLRDSKFLMRIMFRIVVGKSYKYYMEFKDKLPELSEDEINNYYTILADSFIQRDTNLNSACLKKILEEVEGQNVLDAAAGKGFLAKKIYARDNRKIVTAADIVLPPIKERETSINYVCASLTNLPFEDGTFDTVICTHALEHIKDEKKALSELRRVCRNKLVIVVPRQREYLYTYDLHMNFYTYKYKLKSLLQSDAFIDLLDNDWLCIEYMKRGTVINDNISCG